jgi:hypothetical protein
MISNFRANVNKNVRMEKESFLVGVWGMVMQFWYLDVLGYFLGLRKLSKKLYMQPLPAKKIISKIPPSNLRPHFLLILQKAY